LAKFDSPIDRYFFHDLIEGGFLLLRRRNGGILMSDIKSWLAVAVGASLVLNGCAKNQAALVGALSCGIPAAAAGGFV
jgi:hypothetical protein